MTQLLFRSKVTAAKWDTANWVEFTTALDVRSDSFDGDYCSNHEHYNK